MLIYLETIRTNTNEFDLIHSYYIGAGSTGEKIYQWTDTENDRLRAAIVNAGYAANTLAERPEKEIKVIGIESDNDGKDQRCSGEHDTLFALLKPTNSLEANRLRSLHFDYSRYLGRLLGLIFKYNIEIVLQDRNSETVRYS